MKLLLLHGAAKVASRKYLLDFKGRFDPNNVLTFAERINNQDISDNLASNSFFSDERLVILENPPEDFILPVVVASNLTLVLWFDHQVNPQKYPAAKVLLFPEGKEVSIFPLLDKLAAADMRAFLEINKLKKGGFDIYYIITMGFYLLRNLVLTPKNAPQFVRDKLQRQRQNFDLEKITKLYKEILNLDFKLKSGLIEEKQAEFSLVNLFAH